MKMRTPRNLGHAIRKGFRVKVEAITLGLPEINRRVRGKMLLELESLSVVGPGSYELVVPFTASYRFGKPRAARKNERGF